MARTGRTSNKGKHRQPRQYKKSPIDVETKLAAVRHLNEYNNIQLTIQHFFGGLPPSLLETRRTAIYKWRAETTKLEVAAASGQLSANKLRPPGLGTVLSAEAEDELVVWVNDLRGDGIPISSLMLKLKAISVGAQHGVERFSASWSWQKSFMHRHRLSLRSRTRQGQITPAEYARIASEFADKIKTLVREQGITQAYNADQTAAFSEYLPKRTVNVTGAKTVWVRCGGKEKERASVMLLGDADGNRYTPFVVFKANKAKTAEMQAENAATRHGFDKHVWKEIRALQDVTGLHIYGNQKGWWTSDLSCLFLETFFGGRTESSPPVLLIWDEFSGHWAKAVQDCAKKLNVMLERVPAHATGICQPADVAWMKLFKDRLRNQWVYRLQNQLARDSLHTKYVSPGRPEIAQWVRQAWESIGTDIIAAGFRKSRVLLDPVDIDAAALIQKLSQLQHLDDHVGEVDSDDDVEGNESDK